MIISAAFHVAVLLLFIFLIAWRAPNPPHPEIGVELNFGTSDAGSGDIQPDTPPATTETEEQTVPEEEVQEETVEKVVEDTQEDIPEPVEEQPVEAEPEIKPVTDQPTEDPVKEEVVEEVVTEPVEVNEEKKEEPKTDPRANYPGKTNKEGEEVSQGDDKDETGDKGKEEGNPYAKVYEGQLGGGGDGTDLTITGWDWENEPRPKHEDVEYGGKITFEFQVDEKGQVTNVNMIPPSTVSSSLISLYRDELYKVVFIPRGTPKPAKGKVTFIIKAN